MLLFIGIVYLIGFVILFAFIMLHNSDKFSAEHNALMNTGAGATIVACVVALYPFFLVLFAIRELFDADLYSDCKEALTNTKKAV